MRVILVLLIWISNIFFFAPTRVLLYSCDLLGLFCRLNSESTFIRLLQDYLEFIGNLVYIFSLLICKIILIICEGSCDRVDFWLMLLLRTLFLRRGLTSFFGCLLVDNLRFGWNWRRVTVGQLMNLGRWSFLSFLKIWIYWLL